MPADVKDILEGKRKSVVKVMTKPVPDRRLADSRRNKLELLPETKEVEPLLEKEIIKLGARTDLTLEARCVLVLMVWNIRGHMYKKFHYLINRNRAERFWTEK